MPNTPVESNISYISQLDNVQEDSKAGTKIQDRNAHMIDSHTNDEGNESANNSGQVVTENVTSDQQNNTTDNSPTPSHNSGVDDHSEDSHQDDLVISSTNTKIPVNQEKLDKFKNAPTQVQTSPQQQHIEQTPSNNINIRGQSTTWATDPMADIEIPEVIIKQSPHYV